MKKQVKALIGFMLALLFVGQQRAATTAHVEYHAASSHTSGTVLNGTADSVQGSWSGSGWTYFLGGAQQSPSIANSGMDMWIKTTSGTIMASARVNWGSTPPPVGCTLSAGTTYVLWLNATWVGNQEGTAVSASFTTPASPPTPKKQAYSFHNPTGVDAQLNVYKTDSSGNIIGGGTASPEATVTVKAGQFYSGEIDVQDGNGRVIVPVWPNATTDSSGYVVPSPGLTYTGQSTYFPNSAMTTDSGAGGQSLTPTSLNLAQTAPNTNSTAANIYLGGPTTNQVFNTTQVASTTAATNGQIAASTNELIKAINVNGQNVAAAVAAGSTGGSSTTGTDNAGIESRLDDIKLNTGRAYTYGSTYTGATTTSAQNTSATAFNSATGYAAAGGHGPGTGTSVNVTNTGGTLPVLYDQPIMGTSDRMIMSIQQVEIDSPGIATAWAAARAIILAGLGILMIRRCVGSVKTYVAALPATDSGGANVGPENVFPAVVQAKQLAQATTVMTAIVAVTVAMVALVDTYATVFGTRTVATLLADVDLTGIGNAYAFLDHFYPVAASITLGLLHCAFELLLIPMFLGVVTVIKFVKP